MRTSTRAATEAPIAATSTSFATRPATAATATTGVPPTTRVPHSCCSTAAYASSTMRPPRATPSSGRSAWTTATRSTSTASVLSDWSRARSKRDPSRRPLTSCAAPFSAWDFSLLCASACPNRVKPRQFARANLFISRGAPMTRILSAVSLSLLAAIWCQVVEAGEGAQAVLDKAIKALGGADKLGAVKAVTWKSKGKLSIGGADNDFSSQTTLNGLTQMRGEFEGDFMGNKIKGVTVVNGDKGWRMFADNKMELDADAIAAEKRNLYLQVVPLTILPLKGKGFKGEGAGDRKSVV